MWSHWEYGLLFNSNIWSHWLTTRRWVVRLPMELFSGRRWRRIAAKMVSCSVSETSINKTICKFVWQLGKFEPLYPSTKELHGLPISQESARWRVRVLLQLLFGRCYTRSSGLKVRVFDMGNKQIVNLTRLAQWLNLGIGFLRKESVTLSWANISPFYTK